MSTFLCKNDENATNGKKQIDYCGKFHRELAPYFVFECAIKLNMKPLTSATAAIILHRFFREVESENYDEYVREFFIFFMFTFWHKFFFL